MRWYPLRLTTSVRHYVFGGRAIPEKVGKPGMPDGRIAETWEVNGEEGGNATVIDGSLAGLTLRELTQRYPDELVGPGWRGDRVPLVTKFVDARMMLPIQARPRGGVDAGHGVVGVRRREAGGLDRRASRGAVPRPLRKRASAASRARRRVDVPARRDAEQLRSRHARLRGRGAGTVAHPRHAVARDGRRGDRGCRAAREHRRAARGRWTSSDGHTSRPGCASPSTTEPIASSATPVQSSCSSAFASSPALRSAVRSTTRSS